MSVVTSASARTTFGALWKRAPLWRFFALLAPFLTALFLLFPPQGGSHGHAPADQASYTTRKTPDLNPGQEPGTALDARNIAPPAAPPGAAPPLQVAQSAPPRPSAVAASPQSAQLSMVTANPAGSPSDTGLDSAMLGPLYSGSITSTGFTLPLPPGKWAVLSRTTAKTPGASGMAYYLGRIEHKRLTGGVKFFALKSDSLPGQGFPTQKSCIEATPLRSYVFVEGDIIPSDHQSCWIIQNYYATAFQYWADRAAKVDSLERAAGGDLTAKGVSYPQDLIEVRFTRSDKSGYLEGNYLFSPETAGITSHVSPSLLDTDWTAANVQHYPEKIAYIAKMKAWGEAFWPRFKDAFAQGVATGTP
ncbi:MAG: hypothetical protein WA840_09300 [Caulobacteraceae bacterium]